MNNILGRICAIILSISIFVTACAAPSASTAGVGASADSAADAAAEDAVTEEAAAEEAPSADAAPENGPAGEQGTADLADAAEVNEKPGLVILGQEESDYTRAAQSKKSAGVDPKVSALVAANRPAMATGKNYTVMIYIVGSNLESRYGAATNDIREMIGAGLDFDKNNLLVYTGGSKRWTSDISNTYNSVLDLSGGDSLEVTAQTSETADMGTSQTLTEFINYCTSNYPAEHYGLVLWDHGAGPLWGYGSDELFGNDSLLLEELRSAMDGTIFGQGASGTGRKLDWVGFDACLMGSIENARLWKDYADYLVGSEELESGRGWDYSFLSALNETDDTSAIVSAAVEAYGRYYEENKSEFFNPDVTLAALDLGRTEEVIDKTNTLFTAMTQGIGEGQYAVLNQARSRTKAFGLSAVSSREQAYDLLDLRDLTEQISDLYPEECAALQEALGGMIVSSTSNVAGAGGLSIYLPGDNQELYSVSGDLNSGENTLSAEYQGFVDSYMASRIEGTNTDWTMAKPQQNGSELTLQLTQEQVKNGSQFFYTVMNRNSFGDYAVNTGKIAIEPDENNILHIPADPMLLTAETDMEEAPAPFTCVQTESNGGESVYRTVGTYLTPGHEYKDVDVREDEQVVITAKNTDGESEAYILDITSSAGSAWAGGKESVDVTNYESVINAGSISYSPVRDEEGHMLPFTEWEATGYEMYPMCLDKGFRIMMKRASEFNKEFICQVTVKDINGDVHGSEYVELEIDRGKTMQYTETDNGVLYAEIAEDHAVITAYEGDDTEIAVPGEIAGKPVTAIGVSAFSGCKAITTVSLPDTVTEICDEAFKGTYALSEITLPDSLKTIGIAAFRRSGITQIGIPASVEVIKRGAFADTGLESVELPEGLVSIGSIAFANCGNLREIRISGSNENYQTPDGVLYSKDGKTLIQYPGAHGADYKVMDGTEEICYGAFSKSSVQNIEFPGTLRTIGNMAFYECKALESFRLPDSLESVGDLAFGEFTFYLSTLEEKHHFDSVHIGPNVSYIGRDAFFALDTEAFDVDENNEQFASSGGFITSKARDMIIAIPRGMGDLVVIPDGITTLQEEVFTNYKDTAEYVIPDSVFRFGEKVFPYTYGDKDEEGKSELIFKTRLHCSEDSAAAQYAALYNIPFDNITDPAELVCEEVVEEIPETEESAAVTMTWNVYRDRAELVNCVTDDRGTLVIPETFRDLPVTAIRSENMYSPHASAKTKVVIPATVREIEWEFFINFFFLQDIEVAEGNKAYKSVDRVLFRSDGKTLVGYPSDREGTEYVVPDKVETIGDKAFYLCDNLQSVTLPRSLRTVGDNAFTNCSALTHVTFNKGLKTIGKHAFSSSPLDDVQLPSSVTSIGASAFYLTEAFGRIELPEKLEKMGYCAFSAGYNKTFTQDVITIPDRVVIDGKFMTGVLFERFEVSDKNDNYASVGGLLMSKDGRTLYMVPTLLSGDLVVPEGTMYIDYTALDECDAVTDIYLPDSVLDIGGIAQKDYETGEYRFVIHCNKGTEAQKKLEAKGVPWIE